MHVNIYQDKRGRWRSQICTETEDGDENIMFVSTDSKKTCTEAEEEVRRYFLRAWVVEGDIRRKPRKFPGWLRRWIERLIVLIALAGVLGAWLVVSGCTGRVVDRRRYDLSADGETREYRDDGRYRETTIDPWYAGPYTITEEIPTEAAESRADARQAYMWLSIGAWCLCAVAAAYGALTERWQTGLALAVVAGCFGLGFMGLMLTVHLFAWVAAGVGLAVVVAILILLRNFNWKQWILKWRT